MREDGFIFDKLLLTANPSYARRASGPMESGGAAIGGALLRERWTGIAGTRCRA